jgi:hypothetical protein
MCEPSNTEDDKKGHRKPPRSLARIGGEVLTGTATAAAFAFSSLYVVGFGAYSAGLGDGCMDGLMVLGIMAYTVPPFYVLGCAIGVYLVGRIGSQTGSFLATLGGAFLGLPVMAVLYVFVWATKQYMTLGAEKIILYPLVFVAAPSTATLCFNLTRRYKEPPPS